MLLLSSSTPPSSAAVAASAVAASAVAAVPAVRHRGVDLAEDADPIDGVILPGLAGDGRPKNWFNS